MEYDLEEVINLMLNVSGYCDGDIRKSMPVTREEWDMVRAWEVEEGKIGDITFWIHVED